MLMFNVCGKFRNKERHVRNARFIFTYTFKYSNKRIYANSLIMFKGGLYFEFTVESLSGCKRFLELLPWSSKWAVGVLWSVARGRMIFWKHFATVVKRTTYHYIITLFMTFITDFVQLLKLIWQAIRLNPKLNNSKLACSGSEKLRNKISPINPFHIYFYSKKWCPQNVQVWALKGKSIIILHSLFQTCGKSKHPNVR